MNREENKQRGKAYRAAAGQLDRRRLYSPAEAVAFIQANPVTRFDPAIDVAFRLGIDPRHQDQVVRGTVTLPHGTGRTVTVAVFAAGENAARAVAAGADLVGAQDLAEAILGGRTDFTAVVATPDLMGVVSQVGRVLGPRGLMPNPKTGTVTADVAKAVRDIKGGRVRFRADRHGNLHLVLGKASFDREALLENYAAVLAEVLRLRPSAAKGQYLRKVTFSATMGPGIAVDPLAA